MIKGYLKNKGSKAVALGASAVLLLMLGFQNCSAPPSQTPNPQDQAKTQGSNNFEGNGDGYLKLDGTYVNLALDGSCKSSTEEKSVVEVKEGRAFIVKENCAAIKPREVTAQLESKDYNPEALFLSEKLFERAQENVRFSEVICRGLAQTNPDGTQSYADIAMKKTELTQVMLNEVLPIYEAQIKVGSYSPKNILLVAEEEHIERVVKHTRPGGGGEESYIFMPNQDDVAGKMPDEMKDFFFNMSRYSLQTKNRLGRFTYSSNALGINFMLSDIPCYYHDR